MAEVKPHDTRDTRDARDMTPVPTQADLDKATGGKDVKVERPKEPEKVEPYPSQAENDEIKCQVFGTTVEKQKEIDEADKKSRGAGTKDAPDDPSPVPTQAEIDAHKADSMYQDPGSLDPMAAKKDSKHEKHVEAKQPAQKYETRTVEPNTK